MELVLLSGDLLDSNAGYRETAEMLRDALALMDAHVFIAPGNHDHLSPTSPYLTEAWPENVHIFKKQQIERVELPSLSLSVYGAGFQSMDCPALLEDFRNCKCLILQSILEKKLIQGVSKTVPSVI